MFSIIREKKKHYARKNMAQRPEGESTGVRSFPTRGFRLEHGLTGWGTAKGSVAVTTSNDDEYRYPVPRGMILGKPERLEVSL